MVAKYDHAVIYNGVFYPANTPIEVKEEKAAEAEEKTTEAEEKAGKANDNSKRGRKPKSTDTGE